MLRVRNLRALAQGAALSLLGAAALGAAVAGWSKWQHHFWAARSGPTTVTLAELAKVDDPAQLPSTWVQVKFDKAYDTKLTHKEEQSDGTFIAFKYLLVPVGDRWMIAVVPANFDGDTLSGQPWHADTEDRTTAIATIRKDLDKVHHGRLLPFEFHTETDYRQTWTYFGIVMGAFAASGSLFSCLGLASLYQGLFGPGPVTEDEFQKRATVQVDAAIARIFQSAGREGRS